MRRSALRARALAGVVISIATVFGFAGCGRTNNETTAGGGGVVILP